ncbi:MAG: hypothetical protein IPK68_11805 [Bdellovibrionales bacterium]|nr:hypothetical protein [Bdellovibrionales bacterium]
MFSNEYFGNYLEGYTTTSAFIEFYNTERIHGSLEIEHRWNVCSFIELEY